MKRRIIIAAAFTVCLALWAAVWPFEHRGSIHVPAKQESTVFRLCGGNLAREDT